MIFNRSRGNEDILTLSKFSAIFPRARDASALVANINDLFNQLNIRQKEDIAMFLAQCGHESGEFTVFEENLNYSAEALMRVFPRYFPNIQIANQYARKPREIANRVYANRMGNGPENSGDGWKYRGRGIIQLTGKDNYRRCSLSLYKDEKVLLEDPDLLLRTRDSVMAAGWFWRTNNLIGVRDIERATRIINGGLNGIEHRKSLYDRLMRIL